MLSERGLRGEIDCEDFAIFEKLGAFGGGARECHELRKPYEFIGLPVVMLKHLVNLYVFFYILVDPITYEFTGCFSLTIEHAMNLYGFI